MRSLEYTSVAPPSSQGDEYDEDAQLRRRVVLPRRRARFWIVVDVMVVAVVCLVGIHYLLKRNDKSQPHQEQQQQQQQTEDTSPPTAVPAVVPSTTTPPPTTIPHPSSSGPITTTNNKCENYYDCKTDRLAHGHALHPGQAICNRNYMLGVTLDGVFQWQDCANQTNNTKVLFRDATNDLLVYFEMHEDASWNVYSNNNNNNNNKTLLWKKECLVQSVSHHSQCLSHPVLDCPYLHLRKSGEIVLNWIDGEWMARNVRRVYKDLIPD